MERQRSEVVAIWLEPVRHGPAEPVQSAELIAGRGLRGNAHQGGSHQIVVIDEGAWADAVRDLGVSVDPSARRANVMLRGIDLRHSRGRLLRIAACTIRIFDEMRPCGVMDRVHPGLRAALMPDWRAGVSGRIVDGGTIHAGDEAEWL